MRLTPAPEVTIIGSIYISTNGNKYMQHGGGGGALSRGDQGKGTDLSSYSTCCLLCVGSEICMYEKANGRVMLANEILE